MAPDAEDRLRRRLDRERKMRSDAERIAEEVTSELYAKTQELSDERARLAAANEQLEADVARLRQATREARAETTMVADAIGQHIHAEVERLAGAASEGLRRWTHSLAAFAPVRAPGPVPLRQVVHRALEAVGLSERDVTMDPPELGTVLLDARHADCLFEQVGWLLGDLPGAPALRLAVTRHGTRLLVEAGAAEADGTPEPVPDLAGAATAGGLALAIAFKVVDATDGQMTVLRGEPGPVGWRFDLPAA